MRLRAKYDALKRDSTHYYGNWQAERNLNYTKHHQHNAQIDNIIVALGLRDAYPNTRIEEKSHLPGVAEIQSTVFGRDVFLADIELAAAAAKGKEAAARIATAVNNLRNTK